MKVLSVGQCLIRRMSGDLWEVAGFTNIVGPGPVVLLRNTSDPTGQNTDWTPRESMEVFYRAIEPVIGQSYYRTQANHPCAGRAGMWAVVRDIIGQYVLLSYEDRQHTWVLTAEFSVTWRHA